MFFRVESKYKVSFWSKVALKKLYNYAMAKILEIEVAGQAVAIMLKAFAAVSGSHLNSVNSSIHHSMWRVDLKNSISTRPLIDVIG